ncbi:anthrone oxygenase family protein [Brevibacterium sp. W7.2]|uniref:anthrone oxygenase family protein n=1 Tax=Brevibacterium sp. W7.2 TaxID=2823518 RepID=UPI001BA6D4B2|nr:anthrone oxygenase family protein [Brevibacterium sp. W7.2]
MITGVLMITELLAAATLTNGLLAGLFFAFVCAISPAYRRLDDGEFVRGFRAINSVILRPTFLVVFVGAPLTAVAAAVTGTLRIGVEPGELGIASDPAGMALLWIGAAASVVSFLITATVSVPLNQGLDRAPILTPADHTAARVTFETRWNRANLARTLTSTLSVLALASALALG